MKIRGSAAHVYEKYLQLARDANSAPATASWPRIIFSMRSIISASWRRSRRRRPSMPAQQAAQNPNVRQEGSTASQPQMASRSQPQQPQPSSGPSFSLTEGGEGEEEGEEAEAS